MSAWSGFSGGGTTGGGGLTWIAKSADYSPTNGQGVLANTSGGPFNVTLPATPSDGYIIGILDANGTFNTNNLTVLRNGSNIENVAQDLTCDTKDLAIELVYAGATGGWKIKTLPTTGASGTSGWSGAGVSGVSGWSGTSGQSGWSGVSAWSGTSGRSGWSGLSHKVFILGAAGGWGSATNGCTGPAKTESATNKVNLYTLDFVTAAQKYAEWTAYLPTNYTAAATVTATFVWTASGMSTNSVVWGCSARAYGDSVTIDQAYAAGVEVTDAHTATALQVQISDATAAITISGSPAAGQLCQFRCYRLGSGADNLAVTANLIQVIITYT